MAASATLDPMITVKQHGFFVKEGPPPVFQRLASTPGDTPTREESGRGLNRSSLNLIASRASTPLAVPPVNVDYGVSPGLPRVGDVRPADYTHLTPGVKRLMRSVMRGLKAHQDPEAATEGLGGTYFFRNEAGVKIAIMKPCDEEPLAPNNPKGFVGRQLGEPGLKPTVRVGEAASREVAAYLLDHDHFARVPHTVMVRMSHPVFHIAEEKTAVTPGAAGDDFQVDRCESSDPSLVDVDDDELPLKLGSLQEYAPHECDTSEMGASRFSVRDVQRIGILDIRLFNTDRHAGNMLVRRVRPHGSMSRMDTNTLADIHLNQPYELIPIDHGFALPEALEPPYFEWQHWPQALMPFGPEELEYIARLDPRADSDLLRRELPGIREESLRLLEVATTLLKRCAAAGLSLSEIAAVVTRPLIGLDDEPSELEKLCACVREDIDAGLLESDEDEDENGMLSPLHEGEDEEGVLYPAVTAKDIQAHIADGDTSPGADSASTHFQFDRDEESHRMATNTLSDASRQTTTMDDVLFSMDEDGGAGGRSPMAASPDAAPLARLGRLASVAPSLVVKRTGEVATPGGIVGMSFGSALASSDSLPASYDGDSPTGSDAVQAGREDSLDSSGAASVGFPMAASFAPGGCFTNVTKQSSRRAKGQHRRHRVARPGRKARRAQAYPPLVKSRSNTGSPAEVFSGLTSEEWEEFLSLFAANVDERLEDGVWAQSSMGNMNGPAPLMSCPRF